MKLLACNVCLLPDGQRVAPAVLALDADGRLQHVHRLTAEEAAVEWWGGLCLVLPEGMTPGEGAAVVAPTPEAPLHSPGTPRLVWHTPDVNAAGANFLDTSSFRLLDGAAR